MPDITQLAADTSEAVGDLALAMREAAGNPPTTCEELNLFLARIDRLVVINDLWGERLRSARAAFLRRRNLARAMGGRS